MSPLEILLGLSLLGTATFSIMWAVNAVFPSQAARFAQLAAIEQKADAASKRDQPDEASALYRDYICRAERWFGAETRFAAAAWYNLAMLELHAGKHGEMATAAAAAVRCAAEHVGYEAFAAHGREELARAQALTGAFERIDELLDEAEAIRRRWDPPSVSITLFMRARLLFWRDDLEAASDVYGRLISGIEPTKTGDGAYRANAHQHSETLRMDGAHFEEVLNGHARVLYLLDRSAQAESVLARLVSRAKQAAATETRPLPQRLHNHARRLAELGLVGGPRTLAAAAIEHAGLASSEDLQIDAADWAWQSADGRGAADILDSALRETTQPSGRARILAALSANRYRCGEHDEGDQLMREARQAHAAVSLEPTHWQARAASLFARGRVDEAVAIVARALDSASTHERVVGGYWAAERSLSRLADRFERSLMRPDDTDTLSERVYRALFLSSRVAEVGELEEAEAMLVALEVPSRHRWLRSDVANQLGHLSQSHGRDERAIEMLTRAQSLRAWTMNARASLLTWTDLASANLRLGVAGTPSGHEDVRRIVDQLPVRDIYRRYWLRYQAFRHLADNSPREALEVLERLVEMEFFWFGDVGPLRVDVASLRSAAFEQLGEREVAVERAREALALERADRSDDHPRTAIAERRLATLIEG